MIQKEMLIPNNRKQKKGMANNKVKKKHFSQDQEPSIPAWTRETAKATQPFYEHATLTISLRPRGSTTRDVTQQSKVILAEVQSGLPPSMVMMKWSGGCWTQYLN